MNRTVMSDMTKSHNGYFFRIVLSQWWLWHVFVPLVIWLVLVLLAANLNIDRWVADSLYKMEGNSWTLRHSAITQIWMHDRAKLLLAVNFIVLTGLAAASYFSESLRAYRRGLVYLIVAMLTAVSVVSIIKHFSGVDCPWAVSRYGGTHAESVFLGIWPIGDGDGHCFPAGHASAGYSWFALYFFSAAYFPVWRYRALVFALSTGILLGFVQELRGAHFFSHDLWAMGVCWFTTALLSRVFQLPRS